MNVRPEPQEEPFGLQPRSPGVVPRHLLQWVDPTFEEAEPRLEYWLLHVDDEASNNVEIGGAA